MTYKFLNTIIDDLFAFVIKMPLLHRLSVFRDGAFESKFTDYLLLILIKFSLQRWGDTFDPFTLNDLKCAGFITIGANQRAENH